MDAAAIAPKIGISELHDDGFLLKARAKSMEGFLSDSGTYDGGSLLMPWIAS